MPRAQRVGVLLIGAALMVGVGGCGGDDERAEKTTPTITTKSVPTETEPAETVTQPTVPATVPTAPRTVTAPPADPGGGSGGTTVPATPKTTTPDGPANDTPADPDSPAGRFEKYCDAHPGACG